MNTTNPPEIIAAEIDQTLTRLAGLVDRLRGSTKTQISAGGSRTS